MTTFNIKTIAPAHCKPSNSKSFIYDPNKNAGPFRIKDPFGLRKAVFPVFCRSPTGDMQGMGTAFHIDGWGTFLTADHVIDFIRKNQPSTILLPGSRHNVDIASSLHVVLFLGLGIVWGTVSIPESAFLTIEEITASVYEVDAPLKTLRGEPNLAVLNDIAVMQAPISQVSPPIHSVPLALKKRLPIVGEPVLAVGYPELSFEDYGRTQSRDFLEEGMYGAFGVVTNVYPKGRSPSNPSPVFEVAADWPSGMSGGPVFNSDGHVIGIVSRSISSTVGVDSVGYATTIGLTERLGQFIPTLDLENPGWRLGYAVIEKQHETLIEVFKTVSEATARADEVVGEHRLAFGSNRIGSDDFVEWHRIRN